MFRPLSTSPFKAPVCGASFFDIACVISSLTQITQMRLIKLRWLYVLLMLVAALVSPQILGSAGLLPSLLAFVLVIASVNLCLHGAIVFTGQQGEGLPLLSPFLQLCFDLFAWGGYIYLSGGATNPLISVFLPLVAIGAIVLSQKQAWLLGLAAILAYSFLWRFNLPLSIVDAQRATHLHLLGMWLVFAVSAVVVIWFIGQMTQAVRERDAALAKAREQAIRNDWLISMGSLAAGAAHELSTPLATLHVLADEWQGDAELPPAWQADLRLMQKQIEICKQALSQLTQRAGHPRSGAVLPTEAASQGLRRLLDAWLALNPSVSVDIHIAPDLDDQVLMLDISFERAITNFLDNAAKAGAARIVLCAGGADGCLQLSVEDDGPGIAPDTLAVLNAGLPIISDKGMGIGLLLARAAIERRAGRLEIANRSPHGACVRLVLPSKEMEKIDYVPR